jgi:hypothetical protein
MNKFTQKKGWIMSAIAVICIIGITLIFAPTQNILNRGSTYNRSPEGYGAWYKFMETRGTPIKRWQKTFDDLTHTFTKSEQITLLRVYSNFTNKYRSAAEVTWIEKGNTLVMLGISSPVTKANFTTLHNSEKGQIKIDTQRRFSGQDKEILSDKFGGIIIEKTIGKGREILVNTPYLAANAYQDYPGNYEILAQLVTEIYPSNTLLVDEYLHGYKDTEVIRRETKDNLWSYLAKTPLIVVFIQGCIILLFALWGGWHPWGQPLRLSAPKIDNSQAYIQALASVLRRAHSTDFVIQMLEKETRSRLQKALFLGEENTDKQTLLNAWEQHTGHPASELEPLWQIASKKERISEIDLLKWLNHWSKIQQILQQNNAQSQL